VRSAARGAAWSRQQHLAGLLSQTFPSQCASPCNHVSTFGTLVHFRRGESATGFNFSGAQPDFNNTGPLRVSALPSAAGVQLSPTGVRSVFRGIPKPVVSGTFTPGGARLARGGTASVRLHDGSVLQTAIVTFGNQGHLRCPNATSIIIFRSDDRDGVVWQFLATVADAADYPQSQEGPK
jgi:hypothetical protein